MPYEIVLDGLLGGFVTKGARPGEQMEISPGGFLSTEDGGRFVTCLENAWAVIINALPPTAKVWPATVDHLLTIFRRDKTATVYVNELSMEVRARPKRALQVGENVYDDDLADISHLRFPGVSIPNDAGYLFLFSNGWRKGLASDFTPLHPDRFAERTYDVEAQLGHCLAYLKFQHLFRISDAGWSALMGQHWFPFITLPSKTLEEMMNYIEEGWPIDDLLDRIENDIRASAERMRERWRGNPVFADHHVVVEQALDRFLDGDYISSNHILYPRIEGIMRTHHRSVKPAEKATQGNLVSSVTVQAAAAPSMLLPDRFDQYLRSVYFANFDPANPSVLSRHSVAHGVAPANLLDRKAAAIGLLILDQLAFYVSA
jgi:hypothetical protein